ncbi:PqqD family protein [Pseudomonas sp. HMWF032]|uniref:PqqD family protein n=1 Tax=Pseudomonas sp. HMWF032 TaxID=2056866 RepID=UPI000D35E501|nr:PqqD family protein [Pseudomonas sp. HMWF032]PTS82277.1 PqqD family protein [Pseudomonas sp. HMWF032]PTT84304.1 PqqD family protein [Pseudomonas sp. HMWF010]
MAAITGRSTVTRDAGILAAEVGGDLVLMSVSEWHYFGLNSVATDIWKRLERPLQVDALCHALAVDYHADPEVIRNDVLELLHKLADRMLIEVAA